MREIPKPDAPVLIRETLWVNEAKQLIYMWGDADTTSFAHVNGSDIWALSADGSGGQSWKFEDLGSRSQLARLKRTLAGGAATCYNTGFLMGGQAAGPNSSGVLVPGLVTYNMTSQTWVNESATPFTAYGTSVGAESLCLPDFGPSGLVMFLGGVTSAASNPYDSFSALSQSAGVAFDNITLFDPFSRQWYWQTTTGSRPTPRHEFCASGIAGPQGTYEM